MAQDEKHIYVPRIKLPTFYRLAVFQNQVTVKEIRMEGLKWKTKKNETALSIITECF